MKIALTQRSDYFPERDERRDSLDQNWFKLFPRDICIPIPNVLESFKVWTDSQELDFIILTGGNDINYSDQSQNVAPERDFVEKQILKFSQQNNIPVLGVCRGLQMMNIFEGGRLCYDPKRKIEPHQVICKGYKNRKQKKITVNSYHNWIIPRHELSNKFQILAYDEDGHVEAIKHIEYPWLGVMWHPERTKKCQSLNLVMDFVEQMR